jgi:hypothetical protein
MMEGIYEQESTRASAHYDEQIAERRLWTAVLLQAMEDWRSDNMRRQTEAEEFLFDAKEDFERVSLGAGLDPGALRAKLQKMKPLVARSPVFPLRHAA